MASYTCSLTGLPATNPVCTPSGHICSKSLLLTKLSETSGIDPFDPESKRTLDESDLIHLAPQTDSAQPPRPPTATSLPGILKILQGEFDSVLLELYDTRKALEDTRRELSTALYQNDAAVRVIARVCGERDELRARLEEVMKGGLALSGGGEKRGRENGDDATVEAVSSKKARVEAGIPAADMDAMTATWTKLNADRKPIAKLKRSAEEVAEIEAVFGKLSEKKVNVHKSNSNGVLGLNVVRCNDEDYVVSIGKDGQILVYNVTKGVIAHTVACAGVDKVHSMVVDGVIMICASTANEIKLFSVQEEATLVSSMEIDSLVGVTIHPSSSIDAVRILAATASNILLIKSFNGEMEILAKLDDGSDVKFTAGELHPDGFIYAVGTEGGKLIIWDLKTQSNAMTLDVSEGSPITNIAFSENGYHLAISTPSAVSIFDLRKQKNIGTIEEKVFALSFDPTASYLAYATEGVIKVCVAKDWNNVVATCEYEKKKGGRSKNKEVTGGLVWGAGAGNAKVWLVSGCDGERPLRFWGVE